MIIGFIGTVGSGKTLGMTIEAYKYFKKGMTVYSNYGLSFPHEKLDKRTFDRLIEDNESLQDCVLMLDEIHIWLDSRNSMSKKNKAMTYFILQTRKRNVRLLFSTQHFDQVDKRLRKTTDILVYCDNMSNKSSLVEDVGRTVLKQDYFYQYKPGRARQKVFVANPWFSLYDTTEIVSFVDDD